MFLFSGVFRSPIVIFWIVTAVTYFQTIRKAAFMKRLLGLMLLMVGCLSLVMFLVMYITSSVVEAASYQKRDATIIDAM